MRQQTDAPKYSLPEIERKFLIPADAIPDLTNSRFTLIEDRYFTCGRLRLRKMSVSGETPTFKLCKKYGSSAPYTEPITNIYLTEDEYNALLALPGHDLIKRAYKFPFNGRTFRLDEFCGEHSGLWICEIEAISVEELLEIDFPPFVTQEVTHDARYNGAILAHPT